jgi:hypothetical protein
MTHKILDTVKFIRKGKTISGMIDRVDTNTNGETIYGISYVGIWRKRETVLHTWINASEIIS